MISIESTNIKIIYKKKMHEISIVEKILNSLEKEIKKHNADKVKEIQLEFGALLGIDPDNFKFFFREMSRGTLAEKARIKIKLIPLKIVCKSKHKSMLKLNLSHEEAHFPILPKIKCSRCGKNAKIVSGEECKIKKIVF